MRVPYHLKSVKYMQYKYGDVVVVGMVQDRHVIDDISFNVPYGVDTTIPGHLAAQSKDLWRDIGMKKLFKKPGPPQVAVQPQPTRVPAPVPAPQDTRQLDQLAKQVAALQAENQSLRTAMQASSDAQGAKLDALLEAVQRGVVVSGGASQPEVTSKVKDDDAIDGDAPTFLPSQIKMEGVDAHVEVQGESSDSNVGDAAARLRALRKKKKDG